MPSSPESRGGSYEPVSKIQRYRNLFRSVHNQGGINFEDVAVVSNDGQPARFDYVQLFIEQGDDKQNMNVALVESGTVRLYQTKLDNNAVFQLGTIEGEITINPATPEETELVWLVIKKIAQAR